MKVRIKLIMICLGILGVSGCTTDEEIPEVSDLAQVTEELVPYFEQFEAEALERGVTVNWGSLNISGEIQAIDENQIVGQCATRTGSRAVTIDNLFWAGASTLEREYVVFHELGHCVLSRSHLDTQNNNGTCVSIMQSGTTRCRTNYSTQTRSSYLDELFLPD